MKKPITVTSIRDAPNTIPNETTEFDPNNFAHLGIDEKRALIYRAIFENFSSMKNNYLTPGEIRHIFSSLGIQTN